MILLQHAKNFFDAIFTDEALLIQLDVIQFTELARAHDPSKFINDAALSQLNEEKLYGIAKYHPEFAMKLINNGLINKFDHNQIFMLALTHKQIAVTMPHEEALKLTSNQLTVIACHHVDFARKLMNDEALKGKLNDVDVNKITRMHPELKAKPEKAARSFFSNHPHVRNALIGVGILLGAAAVTVAVIYLLPYIAGVSAMGSIAAGITLAGAKISGLFGATLTGSAALATGAATISAGALTLSAMLGAGIGKISSLFRGRKPTTGGNGGVISADRKQTGNANNANVDPDISLHLDTSPEIAATNHTQPQFGMSTTAIASGLAANVNGANPSNMLARENSENTLWGDFQTGKIHDSDLFNDNSTVSSPASVVEVEATDFKAPKFVASN